MTILTYSVQRFFLLLIPHSVDFNLDSFATAGNQVHVLLHLFSLD
jgi:hypothetical protein